MKKTRNSEDLLKQELIAEKLQNSYKRFEIVKKKKELTLKGKEQVLAEIKCIQTLMCETEYDPDMTLFPSEPKVVPFFNDREVQRLKNKIWELVAKV